MIPALMNTTVYNLFAIHASELESVKHTESACFALPVIEPNQPIVLPGQCNANINGQQNFDVANVSMIRCERTR